MSDLLLDRGKTYPPLGEWTQSASTISATGNSALPRPIVRVPAGQVGLQASGVTLHDITIRDIDFQADPGTGAEVGLRWLASTQNLTIENCRFNSFKTGIVLQGYPAGTTLKNITLRQCVISNSFNTSGHSQGLYADSVDGLVLDTCMFTHNGWKVGIAPSTIYSHGCYLQTTTRNVQVLECLFAESANHGLQARSGGIIKRCTFDRNLISLLVGGGDSPVPGGVYCEVTDNRILHGSPRDHVPGQGPWGIDLKNISGGFVHNNTIADALYTGDGAFPIGSGLSGGPPGVGVHCTIGPNTIRNWPGPVLGSSDSGLITIPRAAWEAFKSLIDNSPTA